MTAGGNRLALSLVKGKALEDKAKVEQYRKEIGLFSLSRYLDMFKQMGKGKEIKFAED